MRNQLNALKALIDAQGTQIAALQSALSTRAARPTMGEFDPGFSAYHYPQLFKLVMGLLVREKLSV
jgi:hypothetical protein